MLCHMAHFHWVYLTTVIHATNHRRFSPLPHFLFSCTFQERDVCKNLSCLQSLSSMNKNTNPLLSYDHNSHPYPFPFMQKHNSSSSGYRIQESQLVHTGVKYKSFFFPSFYTSVNCNYIRKNIPEIFVILNWCQL